MSYGLQAGAGVETHGELRREGRNKPRAVDMGLVPPLPLSPKYAVETQSRRASADIAAVFLKRSLSETEYVLTAML